MAKAKKKSARMSLSKGVAHIKASFNNTQVTITDVNGETLAWDAAGTVGFKSAPASPLPSPPPALRRIAPPKPRNSACRKWKFA